MSCVLRLRPERPVGHRLRASVIGVGDATVLPGREENTIPKCPVERECGARHCSLRGTNPASITTDTPARSKRVLWTLPSPLNGERIPLKNSRIEPLNRSSRRKEALTSGTDIHQGTKFEPPYVGCYEVHGKGLRVRGGAQSRRLFVLPSRQPCQAAPSGNGAFVPFILCALVSFSLTPG